VLDALGEVGYTPEIVVLLQPTSPLRRAEHIDGAVDRLIETGADAIVSVVEVPHHLTPGSLMRVDGDRLVPLVETPAIALRQQKPRLYARNGPAVLAVRPESARRQGLYEGDVRALVMDRRHSIDIDDETDLRLAEFWLGQARREAEQVTGA
jgi:CMP-N-acetylneuraminic acid synthetase